MVNWQSLGMGLGAVLLLVAVLRFALVAYAGRRSHRGAAGKYASRRSEFDEKLTAVLQSARAAKGAYKAWPGSRLFRVAAVVEEAHDRQSYYLVPEDGRPLPRFEPGQYLTFQLPTGTRDRPLIRCYSLSDRPREEYYRITIRRVGTPLGRPNLPLGQGSNYFFHSVQVGTTLEVKAPQGIFFLDPTDEGPVVLVGGGIGITPMLSMAASIAHQKQNRQTYLFAGFGNSLEQPLAKQLRELPEENSNIHLDVSFSRPTKGDRLGHEYHHRGYVSIARLQEVLPSNNFHFYVCGLPQMMENLVPALFDWGVPEHHVHCEAFGPASVKGLQRKSEQSNDPCNVEFALAHTNVNWNGSHDSILEFAEDAGVPLDYGCRAGNCGQCVVNVRRGKVRHVKKPGFQVSDSQCLACIGVPQGDVVLDV